MYTYLLQVQVEKLFFGDTKSHKVAQPVVGRKKTLYISKTHRIERGKRTKQLSLLVIESLLLAACRSQEIERERH